MDDSDSVVVKDLYDNEVVVWWREYRDLIQRYGYIESIWYSYWNVRHYRRDGSYRVPSLGILSILWYKGDDEEALERGKEDRDRL